MVSAESQYHWKLEHGPDCLVKLGGAVLVDATHVAPCPVQSMTLYYLAEFLEFGEVGGWVGGEGTIGQVVEKGFVWEFPLVREPVEVCLNDFFNEGSSEQDSYMISCNPTLLLALTCLISQNTSTFMANHLSGKIQHNQELR